MDLAPKAERTEFGHAKIEVDLDRCIACTMCTIICPAAIIELVGKGKDRKAHSREDQDNCMGCSGCEAICDSQAIRVVVPYDFGGKLKTYDRGELSLPRLF